MKFLRSLWSRITGRGTVESTSVTIDDLTPLAQTVSASSPAIVLQQHTDGIS